MPVYRRKLSKDYRFWFTGQHLGTRYHSKAIYHSKRECQQAERDRLREIEERAKHPATHYRLKPLFESRLNAIKLNHSRKYAEENERFYTMFTDYVGDVSVIDVTRATVSVFIQDFANTLNKEEKDNWKVNACIRILKAAFNNFIDTHEIPMRNPLKGIKLYPVKLTAKYIPTDEEIAKVHFTIAGESRLLFDFVEETGSRIMEAVNLKWEDVDDLTTLYTRKAKNSNLTSRKIPTPKCLKDVSRSTGKVFTGYHAYPRFLELTTKGKWNWHALRHRRASIWANEGMTLIEIMHRLGHTNLETTQRYLQLLGYRR